MYAEAQFSGIKEASKSMKTRCATSIGQQRVTNFFENWIWERMAPKRRTHFLELSGDGEVLLAFEMPGASGAEEMITLVGAD